MILYVHIVKWQNTLNVLNYKNTTEIYNKIELIISH